MKEPKLSARSLASNSAGSLKPRTKKVFSYSGKAIASCVLLSTGAFLAVRYFVSTP
jgi:hypothetical protein